MARNQKRVGPQGFGKADAEAFFDGGISLLPLLPLMSGAGTKATEHLLSELAKHPFLILPVKHSAVAGSSASFSWELRIVSNLGVGAILRDFSVKEGNAELMPVEEKSMSFDGAPKPVKTPFVAGTPGDFEIAPGSTSVVTLTVQNIAKRPATVSASFIFYRYDQRDPLLVAKKLLIPGNL